MNVTFVYVTSQFEALHAWKGAPASVQFLANPHRHVFKVRLSVMLPPEADANARDVEFIKLKKELSEFLKQEFGKYHPIDGCGETMQDSCESMASRIAGHFADYIVHAVEVSEDGENGAIVMPLCE